MIKNRAKGRSYYYLNVYCPFSDRRMRSVCSLGNSEKALEALEAWQAMDQLPSELRELGMKYESLEKWKKNILENISKEPLAKCTYKDYNKNRKGLAAPTEAIF